jgi:hypothetical protein
MGSTGLTDGCVLLVEPLLSECWCWLGPLMFVPVDLLLWRLPHRGRDYACRGGGPGRWTARASLRRATWRWWWSCFFGHADGVERTVGDPVAGGASALATTRLWFRVLTRGQQAVEFSGAVRGFFQAKAQRLGANDGNVCGCRNPLWGVVVVILAVLRLRVKTLDLCGLDGSGDVRRYPLEGVVVEPRSYSVSFCCFQWQVWFSVFSLLYL